MDPRNYKSLIRKYVLKNAYDYGKANVKAIIGKIIGENPELKHRIKDLIPMVNSECKRVNTLDKRAIEEEMNSYEYTSKKKDDEHNWTIDFDGELTTRFSPEPNGFIHIGHAKAIVINEKIAHSNGGKFVVKFDDTNPEKCEQKYVDSILRDIKWLGVNVDSIKFVSDLFEDLINYAQILIESNKAYVCTCHSEEIKGNRMKKKACSCRSRSEEENLRLWGEMKTNLEPGKAVLRFKGDMESPNTVMRDPILYRIIDAEHYRHGKKYRIYPTYDFENPISDSLYGINHVFRSKEFELRTELHKAILESLDLTDINYYEFARLDLDGYPVSKRLIRPHVESGLFKGYDDPRLVTIAGLRERGIPAKAIKEFVLSFGLSKQEIKTDLKKLMASVRKYYDPIAKRYFAVRDPVKIKVMRLKPGVVKIPLHPRDNSFGYRTLNYSSELYIDKNDYLDLRIGDIIRLKELGNVIFLGDKQFELSDDQSIDKNMKKIQWVPINGMEGNLHIFDKPFLGDRINPESSRTILIRVEPNIDSEIIQFERIGFVRRKDDKNYYLIA